MNVAIGEETGREMHTLASRLFPLHRSNTGDGVRQTLRELRQFIPLDVVEVASGTPVFDWEVPLEWNIHDAFVKDARGRRLIDLRESTLHLVNGSQPVDCRMPWHELRDRVHTLPDHPDWIPYRTAYFRDNWGFCVSDHQFKQLDAEPDREYEVKIDATVSSGSLTYGELLIPGRQSEEVLVSTHVCHPSLANDNLSGIVVATQLARALLDRAERRYSYRFLFLPATIGAITWLAQNRTRLDCIKHGLILSGVGDAADLTYKCSRHGYALVDRAAKHLLGSKASDRVRPFEPFGYDERQFGSPGINLPVGCLMRSVCGEYPEYHTSGDNLDFLQPKSLADTLAFCLSLFEILEGNEIPRNLQPYCEPRLGERGLYRAFGEHQANPQLQRATMWLLNLADGDHSLLQVAERADVPFATVKEAARHLQNHELLTLESELSPTSIIRDREIPGTHTSSPCSLI